MVAAQIAPNAVIQQNPDFVKLADAYGAACAAPQSLQELQDAVREALITQGPTLIYVDAKIAV
jgi:acetolactate synthase-1/2/3 large subunit/5-guanidino-2-oxopentanoate decarboxylase